MLDRWYLCHKLQVALSLLPDMLLMQNASDLLRRLVGSSRDRRISAFQKMRCSYIPLRERAGGIASSHSRAEFGQRGSLVRPWKPARGEQLTHTPHIAYPPAAKMAAFTNFLWSTAKNVVSVLVPAGEPTPADLEGEMDLGSELEQLEDETDTKEKGKGPEDGEWLGIPSLQQLITGLSNQYRRYILYGTIRSHRLVRVVPPRTPYRQRTFPIHAL